MQERIVELRLGDWSKDGHGLESFVSIRFRGESLSNGVFQKAFDSNVELTGLNPFEPFEHYESNSLYILDWEKLVNAGYKALALESLPEKLQYPVFQVETDEYSWDSELLSFPHLVLWYLTNNTELTYEVVEADSLFTGNNRIVKQDKSTADGLFFIG